MNLIYLEIAVAALAMVLLLLELWTPDELKPKLGYAAAAGLALILGWSFSCCSSAPAYAFNQMYVMDGLALFFKRFFLVAAIFVLIMAVEYAKHIRHGIVEFYVLILLALTGMMFAASANDLIMVFVSLELITVTFYILVGYQRERMGSLEGGIKYLILGALSSAFLVFGLALIFGTATTTNFSHLPELVKTTTQPQLLLVGMVFVMVGLGFKIAAVPFQIWAPDVYQGAPAPVTAFLAVGSKAAGFVLILRLLFGAVPSISAKWTTAIIIISAITILYGNLCAIPQRSLKRLLGYSSIANAGYLLMGLAVLNAVGTAGILYYLVGYLFTLAAAFTVISMVSGENDDISSLAGLSKRSPWLATCLTLSMVSLGGIPPLAGFFGKFLLLKAIVEKGTTNPGFYCLAATAVFGVVVSLYYYFGVIRAIYWSKDPAETAPVVVSIPARVSLIVCVLGMLYLGIYPEAALGVAEKAVSVLF